VIARDTPSQQEKKRSTFTFTVEADTSAEVPGFEALPAIDAQQADVQDATITRLFRSPTKNNTTQSLESSADILYPELPRSNSEELEPAAAADMDDNMFDAEEIEVRVEQGEGLATELEALVGGIEEEVDSGSAEAPATPATDVPEASEEIVYPALPTEIPSSEAVESSAVSPLGSHAELAIENGERELESEDIDMEDDIVLDDAEGASPDEEFTEESLQLHILRNYEEAGLGGEPELLEATEEVDTQGTALMKESYNEENVQEEEAPAEPTVSQVVDITDGLTLSFTPAKASSATPTPRKLHSPPPPPMQSAQDDVTMTIALDDDTALLKDFLNRAKANKAKAEKAAVLTHRRESLQNRRDSDVIRHALASPRKALEEKDPNSPSKYDNELMLDLSQTLTLNMDSNALSSPNTELADDGEPADEKSSRGSRRSTRAKKSRLPAPPASAAQAPPQTSKIAIRRPDGTEHVVLKKSDAQELSLITRNNTRKNKQGAFCVTVRLMKLAMDSANLPPLDESTRELVVGKNIRWDEQLAYYQENPEVVAERESLATPDELSMPDAASTPSAKPKNKVSKNSTPKIRRVRGLGTANGTPGKVLRAPPPTEDDEEKETPSVPPPTTQQQSLPRPKSSKIKKLQIPSSIASTATPTDSKLPSLDVVPVGITEQSATRKSRLTAPKKVILPQPVSSLPAEGKENNTQRTAIGGFSGATPKKGIPAPKVIVPPSVGVESGLPRRRGRKV
jgi:hypothetical protein